MDEIRIDPVKAIKTAIQIYAEPSDDNIEIDKDAKTSEPGDPTLGIWVQAWVYVSVEDMN